MRLTLTRQSERTWNKNPNWLIVTSGNFQNVQCLPHETRIETDLYFRMKFRMLRFYVSEIPNHCLVYLYQCSSESILISNKQIKTLFLFLLNDFSVRFHSLLKNEFTAIAHLQIRIPVTMDCLTIDKSTQWRFTRRVMLDSAFFSVDYQLTVCDVTSVIEVPRELNKIIGCQKQWFCRACYRFRHCRHAWSVRCARYRGEAWPTSTFVVIYRQPY